MFSKDQQQDALQAWKDELQDVLTIMRQTEEQLQEEINLLNVRMDFLTRVPVHVRQVLALELRSKLDEKTAELTQWQSQHEVRLRAIETLIQMLPGDAQ